MPTICRVDKPFLKLVSISLILVLVLICLGNSTRVYAYDQPVAHWEYTNTESDGTSDAHVSSSFGYMGAEWSDIRDAWCFNFRVQGDGATRWVYDGSPIDTIATAAFEVVGTYNTNHMYMFSSSDTKYIGSAPESSGATPDYENIATAVTGFAINAINNFGISFAWSVAELIDALHSTVDNSESPGDYLLREWSWSNNLKSDVGQFFYFLVDVDPNQAVQISFDYTLFGYDYYWLNAGIAYYSLVAPGPGSKSGGEDWNPGMMTAAEKDKYGIEAIPLDKFEKRAVELGISPENVKEFYNSGEKTFYYAHNLPVYKTDKIME